MPRVQAMLIKPSMLSELFTAMDKKILKGRTTRSILTEQQQSREVQQELKLQAFHQSILSFSVSMPTLSISEQ